MARATQFHSRLLGAAAAWAAAFLGISAAPGLAADDTSLFSTTVAPNVLIVADNSGSMEQIVWHPAFDPNDEASWGCNAFDDGGDGIWGWETIDSNTSRTYCGKTRTLYHDSNLDDTRWDHRYLNWYFGLDTSVPAENTILNEIAATANGSFSFCVGGGTYSLYRRSRTTALKTILREVICRVNEIGSVRFGLAIFREDSDPEGGFVVVPVDDYTPAQDTALENAISDLVPEAWTPLGETLFQAYTYFMSRDTADLPLGKDDTTVFPKYVYNTSTASEGGLVTANPPPSPVQYGCQRNFVLIITDGEPTRDDFDLDADPGTDKGFADFVDKLIGDYNDDGETEFQDDVVCNNCETALYLDDIAKFMQERDFRPDFSEDMRIDVYTVGFTTSDFANDLLEKTADVGNGQFYFSTNAEELTQSIVDAVTDIVEKSQAFTAATVPASRASDGNNFYTSYFEPSDKNPFWEGHLKLFEFNRAGEIRDKPTAAQQSAGDPGDCAVADPVPGRCRAGRLKIELDGYWDAADEIPLATVRSLYVSMNQGGRPSMAPSAPQGFNEANVDAADLNLTGDFATTLAKYSGSYDTTGITDMEELADAVVRFLRGCEFSGGSCSDRGDSRKLWDIFHSNPVVVGPPNRALGERSYREFARRYKHRKRVIFAASNGGFVHGFNSGEYGTPSEPNGYNRGDGVEEFAFMAYPARQNIAELPIDKPPRGTGSWSGYSMDGSPVAADVWLHPVGNPEVDPDDVPGASWNRWRTVLLGGMRQGGRAIWALDVTNPPDFDDPSGEQISGPSYPGYLWEFPCESADAECTGTADLPAGFEFADYMGETWSEPVVTRVKLKVSGTEAYDRWVAIFGAGYDPAGDPNHIAYDASGSGATSRAGRAVFMVDIATGEVIAMRRFHHNSTDSPAGLPAMKYAFAAAPAVFDLDFDGYGDVVYFGDLGGNLWKWVIRSAVVDPIHGLGDIEQAWDGTEGWKFLQVLAAEACTGSDTNVSTDGCSGGGGEPAAHYRSFFFPPTGALVGASLWLALGSGERADLDFEGTLAAQRNRFYVFRDADPLELDFALPAVGTPRYSDDPDHTPAVMELVDADSLSGSCTPPAPPAVGYYLQGEDGEKFITDTEIFFGKVFTGSFKPVTTGDPCEAGGEAFLYGFDLFCAEGVFDGGSPGSTVRRISVGEGLPNRPRVSVGPIDRDPDDPDPPPCQDMVVVITSEGESFSSERCGGRDDGVHMKSWRDF